MYPVALALALLLLVAVVAVAVHRFRCGRPALLLSTGLAEAGCKGCAPGKEPFKEALEDMREILSKHNVEFFLFCGTALGCHREKNFIEHDHDIDIGVFQWKVDLKALLPILALYPGTFRLSNVFPNIHSPTELTFTHSKTNINVDIFEVESRGSHYYFYTYTNICDYKPNRRCEFKFTPFTLEKTTFLGKEYLIPPKSYLKDHYGPTWHIPQKLSYQDIVKRFSQ